MSLFPSPFRSIAIVLALLTGMTAAAPVSPPEEIPDSLAHFFAVMASTEAHFNVVVLGDSNTEVNWTSRGHLNWVGLLQAGLFEGGAATRYVVINAGKSGDMASGGLARLERDVLAHDPDLVIVCLGTNEAVFGDPATVYENLTGIIEGIRAASDASILLRTSQPLCDHEANTWTHTEEFIMAMEAIRRVAEEQGIALLDHDVLWREADPAGPPSELMYDNLHPNEIGHRRLYAEIAPVLGLPESFRWE